MAWDVGMGLGAAAGAAVLAVAGVALQLAATLAGVYPPAERTPRLFALRSLHIAANLGVLAYPLVFRPAYDGWFLLAWAALGASWMLMRKECALSYVEKTMLHAGYRLGDRPYHHPYMEHAFVRADGSEHPATLVLPVGMHVVLLGVAARYAASMAGRAPTAALVALVALVAHYATGAALSVVRGYVDVRSVRGRACHGDA